MTDRDESLDACAQFILRELTLLREETRAADSQIREDIHRVRLLIERELYGSGGVNGLKTQVSKNTEFRENFTKYRVAIVGAFVTGLLSLAGVIIRALLGLG